MDKQEIEKRIKLGRSFVVKFGDEEGVDEDYAPDQALKKPQPPLTKAPMTDRMLDLPTDFSGLAIDGDFLHIINSRKSHRVYTQEPMSLLELSYLLWCTQGVKAVRGKAYARYSGFRVGAALVGQSGQVYLGVNIENASYPAGICAERSAICAAVSAGEQSFSAIAIVGGEDGEPCYPCGICRQVLSEFCGPDFPVILADGVYSLGGLLPHSFAL